VSFGPRCSFRSVSLKDQNKFHDYHMVSVRDKVELLSLTDLSVPCYAGGKKEEKSPPCTTA
jgi:hypothetical protein